MDSFVAIASKRPSVRPSTDRISTSASQFTLPPINAPSFARIIAQLVGAAEATGGPPSDAAIAPAKHDTRQNSEERSDDEALVDQLAAASRPKRRTNKAPARKDTSAPSSDPAFSTGFTPLVNARLPRKR